MDIINLLDPARNRFKMMLVMPETKRPVALLVDEEMGSFHLGNFGHPRNGDAGKRTYLLGND